MSQETILEDVAGTYNTKQQLFIRYFTAILIDLTVLNLFDEYWDLVTINSFTISVFAAIMLQVLLKLTMKIEHHVADYFRAKPWKSAKFLRLFSAWLILFLSKFVILGAVNIAFGEKVVFSGPLHGVVAFIVVLVVMLVTEILLVKFSRSLRETKVA